MAYIPVIRIFSFLGKGVLSFLLVIITGGLASGQACCSGGAPLSGNLLLLDVGRREYQMQLTYDFNTQRDLLAGSDKLDDDRRRRNTHALLLRNTFGLTEKLALSALLSMVRQEEVIRRSPLDPSMKVAQGVGDALLMGQYKVLEKKYLLLIAGAGAKIPLGKTGITDPETGLLLHPDLQPGSGAWDLIGGFGFYYHHFIFPNLTWLGNLSYTLTMPGRRLDGRQKYEFGDEFRLTTGWQGSYLLGTLLWEPSLLLMYRYTLADKVNDARAPNTGGHWLHLRPGIDLAVNTRWRIGLAGDIPLFRYLEGVQLTTSYRLQVNIGYAINAQRRFMEEQ